MMYSYRYYGAGKKFSIFLYSFQNKTVKTSTNKHSGDHIEVVQRIRCLII
jgi:hypothetical protein